jgi:phosphoribosylaminoimidazole-succinocarboxamide synthase
MNVTPLFESRITGLERIHQGKVRDIYAIDDARMLIVTTDRLSAFDVVLPDPIPHKGRVLTAISAFWFARTRRLIENQLTDFTVADVVSNREEQAALADRAIVVRRLEPLPLEAVARGYLSGSGWKDYQRDGGVCGIELPQGLRMADRLPEPIFTPATKAPRGQHDENVGFDAIIELVGFELAARVRAKTLEIYNFAAQYARERGIIIADTKFEFGLDRQGSLVLIDEVLTPDSSRFWPADTWKPGASPPSFDKQYVRDYLETLDWDKKPPGPRLPPEVIRRTSEKYVEAQKRLTGPART